MPNFFSRVSQSKRVSKSKLDNKSRLKLGHNLATRKSTFFSNKLFYISLVSVFILLMLPINVFASDKIPFQIYNLKLGEIDPEGASLPVITFVIALVDGFNPCAMSILLFLITILLDIKEAWKRWYLGGIFLLTSALSYFLFLISWLKINEFVGLIPVTRSLIALAAWIIGIWSLNSWWENRNAAAGCKVSEQETSRKFFGKIKEILGKKSLFLASIGIAGLAFSVNFFELLCSAALPATYTNILAGSGVNAITKNLYLLFYVLIFMIDDLLVFSVAMITLQTTGLTNKYNNLVKLISGIIMILLALWITIEVLQGFGIL